MNAATRTQPQAAIRSAVLDGPVPHRDADTSREAAERLQPKATLLRAQVLAAIRAAGDRGLTAHEAAEALGVTPWTTAPRCSELREAGLVEDSGDRRENASGRRAIVWRARAVPRSFP